MDISATHNGILKPHSDRSGSIYIEMPVVFSQISTGPLGIIDVVVRRATIADKVLQTISDPTVHSLEVSTDSEGAGKTLAGDLLNKRPLQFASDHNGNSTLVLVFTAIPSTKDLEFLKIETGQQVSIDFDITFSNSAKVLLTFKGERLPASGTLVAENIGRRTRPLLTIVNPLFLLAIITTIYFWNNYFNVEVYMPKEGVLRQALGALAGSLAGSLATFLYLFYDRIKNRPAPLAWAAVIKYPELSIEPALFRALSSRTLSILLLIVAGFSAWLIHRDFSDRVRPVAGLAVFDSLKDRVVNDKRIYRSELSGQRFILVCEDPEKTEGGQEKTGRKTPISLAYLRPSGAIEDINFVLEHKLWAETREIELSGIEWASGNLRENRALSQEQKELWDDDQKRVMEFLCNESTDTRELPDGTFIKAEATERDPARQRLILTDRQVWTAKDVGSWLEDYLRHHLAATDFDVLFNKRKEKLEELGALLTKKFENNGLVETTSIVALTSKYLNDIGQADYQQQAIERSILLRGIWKAAAGPPVHRDRAPNRDEIASIAEKIRQLLATSQGWKVERSLLELLLQIQAIDPGNSGDSLHKAAIANWTGLPGSDRYPKYCEYIVTSLLVDSFGEPQFNFLKEHFQEIKLWAGPNSNFVEFLVKRERSRGADPTFSEEVLFSKIGGFERSVGLLS